MVVREATESDVQDIKRLIDQSFDEVISKYHSPHIVNKFKDHNSEELLVSQLKWKKVYVADDNGCILGTGAFANFGTTEAPKYAISNLYVLPTMTGQGIGTQIVNVLFADAKKNNASTFHVPSTRNAVRFYKQFGFVVDEYQPDNEDEITWMSIML